MEAAKSSGFSPQHFFIYLSVAKLSISPFPKLIFTRKSGWTQGDKPVSQFGLI